jgi:chromate reductase, NAD(P)H dehydrogenase (quinone)
VSLRTVLGYVGAPIVESACVKITVGRDAVGPDGLVAAPDVRERIEDALRAFAAALR